MIIEGRSRGKGKGNYCLATHLLKQENERVRIVETRDTLLHDDLHETLSDWQMIGAAIGCKKPLYHANISPDETRRLTEDQKITTVDRLEKALGFTGQPRIVIEHEKKGREHLHVVWLRIDTERMRVLSDSFNYYKHERVATALEQEFGLEKTKRALTRDEGLQRPAPAPTKPELQQGERSGLSPKEVRRQVSAIWNATSSGAEFQCRLDEQGWILARGDRTAFVVVDPHGEVHALARRIDGVRTAQIRERLADVEQLPSVAAARQLSETRRLALAERGRLHSRLKLEERAPGARIAFPKAAREIEGKRQRRAAWDRGDGDMQSEQKAALKRFARNSGELDARRRRGVDVGPARQRTASEGNDEKSQAQQRKEYLKAFEATPEQRADIGRAQGRSRGRSR